MRFHNYIFSENTEIKSARMVSTYEDSGLQRGHFGMNFLDFDKIPDIAEGGFDPPTSGLWAQHASSAPLC